MQKKVCTVDINESQSTSFLLKWLGYSTRTQTAYQMAKPPNTYGTLISLFSLRVWTSAASKYSTGDSGLALLWETDIKAWRMVPQLSLVIKKRLRKFVCDLLPVLHTPTPPKGVNELKLTQRRFHIVFLVKTGDLGHSSGLKQMPFTKQKFPKI